MKVSDDQLGVIIASQIRERGLNDVFDASVVDSIKAKIKAEYKRMREAPSQESVIPEADGVVPTPSAANTFPYDVENDDSGEVPPVEIDVKPAMEAGGQATDVAYDPKVYTPELPDMLKHVKPAKLVAMELSELENGGELLASKPFRTLDDIDVQKSMMDLWKEEGCTKAEVYIIKYEKAGEMAFDYTNGTSVFIPTPSEPEAVNAEPYKENPYSEENPNEPNKFKEPSTKEIENYVRTSVDVEDIVKRVALELMTKTHQEQSNEYSRSRMGMSMPETPIHNDAIPDAIYESYQLGEPVTGVEFISSKNGASSYKYDGKTYVMYESSAFNKRKA